MTPSSLRTLLTLAAIVAVGLTTAGRGESPTARAGQAAGAAAGETRGAIVRPERGTIRRAVRRPVKLGLDDGTRVEIISGVRGDEAVVKAYAASLEEGQAVVVAETK